MKNDLLVSVIVNCYNGEKFVNRCIQSILSQKHKNLEIIFWDNLSTDRTPILVKKFKDKRIKYFKSYKHTKLYEARNLAIRKAKGKFVSFLDIDDTWEKNKLSLQIKKILKTKSDICFSNHWIFEKKLKIFKNKIYSKNIFHQILNDYPISILTVIMKREIFNKLNYFFDSKYEIIGDFDLFFRLSKKIKFCTIDKPLATYYIHQNNLSIKKISLEIKEFEKWIKKNSDILNKNMNSILLQNNIRKCNYLLSKKKLSIFSKEFSLLNGLKLKVFFLLKIVFYKIK